MKNLLFVTAFIFMSCSSVSHRSPQSEDDFLIQMLDYDTKTPLVNKVNLRTAIFRESKEEKFKGCILYLEGLADSIRNHLPLFNALTRNGYRVLAFDYMGQGGSQGSMNHTRLRDLNYPVLEIGNQAKTVWEKYTNYKNKNGLTCSNSRKRVIGWSTGGLAAYKLAYEGWADDIVLIAPGIYPKTFVGEAAHAHSMMFTFQQVITERTLTNNKFEDQQNPHMDPIKPISPALVPLFSANLLLTSNLSHQWQIPERINGLVFLSGSDDTYVDKELTKVTLAEKAPHFSVVEFNEALHEIDNEIPTVANAMYLKTLQFFNEH